MSSSAPRVDLSRPRDLGRLISDGFGLYVRHFGVFVTIAAAVVIPVEVIVSGIGLEQISSGFGDDPTAAETAIPLVVSYLVTVPLITGMTIYALLRAAGGEDPSSRASIAAGLDVFAPVFGAVILAAVGIAAGLFLFIVPGVYLAVRWYFVAQAVVIDGRRGSAALRRSGELVTGEWWRVLGVAIVVNLIVIIPAAVVGLPLSLAAEQADRAVLGLAGSILAQLVTVPYIAIVGTLLFFDLSARKAGRVPSPVAPPPPPGAPPPDQGAPPPARPPDPPGLPPRG
ncbi:MAG: glycerophosphoryl diester phosphodiesterase membrane domain-containing protein [Thermoleophilaceae bacterium]